MEGSNNPEGTAHVTDDVLISALRESLAEDDETLAVPASSVSEELPIKQQAVKKRLNRLEKEDSPVRRYRGAQAWHYYTAESLAQMADAEAGEQMLGKAKQAYTGKVGLAIVVVASLAQAGAFYGLDPTTAALMIAWGAVFVLYGVGFTLLANALGLIDFTTVSNYRGDTA